MYYTSPDNFLVSGTHICAFDHEREYHKRVRYNMAIGVMEDNALMRVRDVVATVKNQTTLSQREEETLTQFVSSRRLTRYGKCPEDLSHFVIPDCLKVVEKPYDDGDDLFLIHDSFDDDKDNERILVFSSCGMRQRASIAKEIFADGTYRSASNEIATLYTVHTVVDGLSFPIFFIMLPNEKEETFKRAFVVIKPFMHSFGMTCTAHVDCQLAAINAIHFVFHCSIRICLFHQNQAVWRAVARFGLAGHYNSTNFPRLHVWIRRLLALPFLNEYDILSNFSVLFEQDAVDGKIHVEDCCLDQFKKLVAYYKSFWIEKITVKLWCNNAESERTNNRCEGFHNGLRRLYKSHIQIFTF